MSILSGLDLVKIQLDSIRRFDFVRRFHSIRQLDSIRRFNSRRIPLRQSLAAADGRMARLFALNSIESSL